MKRSLIALTLVLGLANVAFADNNDVFAEPYWKHAKVAASQTESQSAPQSGKYDIVDRYNP